MSTTSSGTTLVVPDHSHFIPGTAVIDRRSLWVHCRRAQPLYHGLWLRPRSCTSESVAVVAVESDADRLVPAALYQFCSRSAVAGTLAENEAFTLHSLPSKPNHKTEY
jgi:hypothetical protein